MLSNGQLQLVGTSLSKWPAEALGHLNEAGVAARAAPQSPHREPAANNPPSSAKAELSNGLQEQAGTETAPQ